MFLNHIALQSALKYNLVHHKRYDNGHRGFLHLCARVTPGAREGRNMMPLPYAALLVSIIIMISFTIFVLMRRYHDQ